MINEIPKDPQIEAEPQHRYEITVKDMETGKVIYQNIGHAGVATIMEHVKVFGPDVEGDHQHLAWGNPILQMYCYDQLNRWFKEEGFIRTMEELERRGFIKVSGNIKDMFKK